MDTQSNPPKRSLSIGVYFFDVDGRGETTMQRMNATSDYLTQLQLIPVAGDWISILCDDWPTIGISDPAHSSKSIMIVESRLLSFGPVDVAVICNFKEWMGTVHPTPGWQQVPLN